MEQTMKIINETIDLNIEKAILLLKKKVDRMGELSTLIEEQSDKPVGDVAHLSNERIELRQTLSVQTSAIRLMVEKSGVDGYLKIGCEYINVREYLSKLEDCFAGKLPENYN